LQEVIADYEGTVLIVSHDRDFLDRTVTVTLGLDGSGKVDVVAGGYEDWEARRGKRAAPAKKAAPLPPAGGAGKDTHSSQPPPAGGKGRVKLSYKDQRDYDLLPARIEELDAAIAREEAVLADPELFTRDPDRFHRAMAALEAARAEKAAAEERWLALAELVEG
jgi:ATP-binding cassette subfamily F protein uup